MSTTMVSFASMSESENDLCPFLIASLSAHGYDSSNEPIRNENRAFPLAEQ